jgi:elongation factor G
MRVAEGEARFERMVQKSAVESGKGAKAQKATPKADEKAEMLLVFGAARVRVGPRARGAGIAVRAEIAPLPSDTPERVARLGPALVEAALEGVREAVRSGPGGYPMEDLEAVLISVEPREGLTADSAALGARIAGGEAFRRALEGAAVRMLEPIMLVEVVVPEEFMGAVVGDLNARHAQIQDLGYRGAKRTVVGKVPLKALFGYATALRSATQGRGTFTMQFAAYDAWE